MNGGTNRGGYDKFFKDARKASQGVSQAPRKNLRTKRSAAPRFALHTDRSPKKTSKHQESASQELVREMMKERLQTKLQARRERPKFPVAAFCVAVCALGVSVGGYLFPEKLEQMLAKVEIGAFGAAEAKTETKTDAKSNSKAEDKSSAKADATKDAEKLTSADGGKGENSAATADSKKKEPGVNTKGWTEEEMSFFNKLGERKKELDTREAELNKLDEELQKQKIELEKRIQYLEQIRAQIGTTLKSKVSADQEKVDKLVQFYSGMKPAQAAKVMESINEELAVGILDKMKKKNAADILNAMESKKAQKLSEVLAGYKRAE